MTLFWSDTSWRVSGLRRLRSITHFTVADYWNFKLHHHAAGSHLFWYVSASALDLIDWYERSMLYDFGGFSISHEGRNLCKWSNGIGARRSHMWIKQSFDVIKSAKSFLTFATRESPSTLTFCRLGESGSPPFERTELIFIFPRARKFFPSQ